VLKLLIYPTRVTVSVQDPQKKENVDEYVLQGESIAPPTPVQLYGGDDPGALERNLFDLASLDFAKIPAMIADTKQRLPLEGAKVSHVFCERALPFRQDVICRVHLSGTRKSGMVEYDLQGRMVKVHGF
jgi:hypothetical protein